MSTPIDQYKLVPEAFAQAASAEAYTCRFARPRGGWAVLLLHDPTGMVAIESDYGSWVYSWSAAGRRQRSVKDFLLDCDYEYVATKLMGRDARQDFDGEATAGKIKAHILELRREGAIEKARARVYFDDIETHDQVVGEEVFWATLPDSVRSICDDFYDYAVHRPSAEYLWLRDGILPALFDSLRAALAQRRWVAGPHGAAARQADEDEISHLARLYTYIGVGQTQEQAAADLAAKERAA